MALDTVEACEEHLQLVEGQQYLRPQQRRRGRPPAGTDLVPPPKHVNCPCCEVQVSQDRSTARQQKKELLRTNPEKFAHGSATTYGLGCKCEPCLLVGRKKRADANAENKQAGRLTGSAS